MNEGDLVRRLLGEPGEDPDARSRARARLQRRMTAQPRRRGSKLAALGAVVLVVGLLVAITTPFPMGDAVARELNHLKEIPQPKTSPLAPGDTLHLSETAQRRETRTSLSGAGSYTIVTLVHVDTWVQPDASGKQRTSVQEVAFASDADRAAWTDAGSPPIPSAGDVSIDQLQPGEWELFDTRSLSSDPETLLTQLRSDEFVEHPPGDDQVLIVIADLLSSGGATPEIRSALFSVTSRLQGVSFVGDVSDPLGRKGVGFVVSGNGVATMIVFDPTSAETLATETFPAGANFRSDTPTSWQAFQPVEVVSG